VRDLLGGDVPALPEQPSDAVLEGSFENDASSLGPCDVGRFEAGLAHERVHVSLMHAMGMTARRSFGLEQVEFSDRTFSLRDPLPRLT